MTKYRVRQGKDNKILYKKIEDLPTAAHQVFRDGFFGYMQALKKEANKEILRKPKGGRTYYRRDKTGRRRRHIASAPGETHANMTGTLRRSLGWKVHGWQTAEFGYGISSGKANKAPLYAGAIELGSRNIKPRPSLRNAVKVVRRDIHFDRALDKYKRRRFS